MSKSAFSVLQVRSWMGRQSIHPLLSLFRVLDEMSAVCQKSASEETLQYGADLCRWMGYVLSSFSVCFALSLGFTLPKALMMIPSSSIK